MIKPKLRFPEFNGEWEELSIENSTEKIIDYRGKTPNKTDSGIPLITAKIIKDGKIDKATEFISENNYDTWMKRGIPKSGDVLITSEAPLGEVAQINGSKIALAQRIIALRGKKRLVNNTFLLHILTSPSTQYKIKIKSTGSTVHGIKQKELRKVLLEIPTFSEQEKIAYFLSQVDQKIGLLETNFC